MGVIDCESGEEILFGNDLTVDDIIWTGPQPTIADLAAQVGVGVTKPLAALADYISAAQAKGRKIHYLPPYRGETKIQLAELLGHKIFTCAKPFYHGARGLSSVFEKERRIYPLLVLFVICNINLFHTLEFEVVLWNIKPTK